MAAKLKAPGFYRGGIGFPVGHRPRDRLNVGLRMSTGPPRSTTSSPGSDPDGVAAGGAVTGWSSGRAFPAAQ